MYEKEVTIKNPTGLHARPASDFIGAAGKFASKISIRRVEETEDDAANAKSIIHLLSLGLCQGERVSIKAEGDDEQQAVDSLVELIESGFGE